MAPSPTTFANWSPPRWALGRTLAQSPTWRTPPALHLADVDVTSAPFGGGTRELVGRYWLTYIPNANATQVLLQSVREEGTCSGAVEDATGALPSSTHCPSVVLQTMTYSAPPLNTDGLKIAHDLTLTKGPYLLADGDGDGIPELWGGSLTTPNVVEQQSMGGAQSFYTLTPTPPLQATLSSLFPRLFPNTGPIGNGQDPFVALGDWFGDGQVNWLWGNLGSYTLEAYSLRSKQASSFVSLSSSPTLYRPPLSPIRVQISPGARRWTSTETDSRTSDMRTSSPPTGPSRVTSRHATSTGRFIPSHGPAPGRPAPRPRPFSARGAATRTPPTAPSRMLDGDGLADVVVLENTTPAGGPVFGAMTAHVFKSRGDGRLGLGGTDAPACANQAYDGYDLVGSTGSGISNDVFGLNGVAVHDVDGDGLADLVYVAADGVHIALQGRTADTPGFSGTNLTIAAPVGCPVSGPNAFDPSQVSLLFAVMNGSGVDDIVLLACGTMSWTDMLGGARPNLLETISSPAGAVTTLAYDSIRNLPSVKTSVPVPVEVVTQVKSTNGLSGPYALSSTVAYTYDSPVYDARDRAFVGFQNVTATTKSDAHSPGIDTTTHFATTTCAVSPGKPCAPSADYPYRVSRGLPAVVEQKDNGNSDVFLTTTVNTYSDSVVYASSDGRSVREVFLSQSDQYLWDPAQQGEHPDDERRRGRLVSGRPVHGSADLRPSRRRRHISAEPSHATSSATRPTRWTTGSSEAIRRSFRRRSGSYRAAIPPAGITGRSR